MLVRSEINTLVLKLARWFVLKLTHWFALKQTSWFAEEARARFQAERENSQREIEKTGAERDALRAFQCFRETTNQDCNPSDTVDLGDIIIFIKRLLSSLSDTFQKHTGIELEQLRERSQLERQEARASSEELSNQVSGATFFPSKYSLFLPLGQVFIKNYLSLSTSPERLL